MLVREDNITKTTVKQQKQGIYSLFFFSNRCTANPMIRYVSQINAGQESSQRIESIYMTKNFNGSITQQH